MQTYLVGGAVRDRLLGRPIKDRDWVVVGASADQMLAGGFRRVGKSFPVFIHPSSGDEYTLACRLRGDLSTAGPEVTIEEDLCARDLSINAMAETADGRIIDPVGGLRDLETRTLRHVRPDGFRRDPLRVLRVARLAAELAKLGFRIAPETYRAMRSWRVGEGLRRLAGERVWAELERALASDAPVRFFVELRETGILGAVFPEIEQLFGIPQPAHWHPEIDTGRHTLMVLEQARALSPRTDVRYAALTHDLGKGNTPKDILPSHRGHEERGVRLIEQLGDRLHVPRAISELARLTARWHPYAHRVARLRPSTVLDVLEGTDALRRPERFGRFLLACEADYRGRSGFENRCYPQREYFWQALVAAARVDAAAIAGGAPRTGAAAAIRQARLVAVASLGPPAVDQPR